MNAGGVVRHDIQLREDEAIPDVPAVFPPTPGMPKAAQPVSAEEDPDTFRKLTRMVTMKGFFQRSPYHLKLTIEEKLEGSAPDVVQYLDMGTSLDSAVSKPRSKQANATPLHQMVVMHDKYLPAELYSAKEAAASMKKRNADFFKKFGRTGKDEQREVNEALRQAEEEKEGQEKDEDKDNDEEALPEEEDDDDDLDHILVSQLDWNNIKPSRT
eukprot:TRINITY_DN22859_c2_g1_i2.p1 TRINITY_DN22859_c2_g1~~TRINITY_DN22859_c2_g1_i2.p1  ORF type:complete len:225 (+),score=44.92 TRINITY_DN22859_c2_g1_i2:39-677(+)